MQSYAGFSLGSWLASVPAGGSGVLNALFGDAFHLNAVSYNGLVNANVTLQQLGLNIPVTALSPTELLNTSVGIRDFMLASIAVLSAQGNTAAVGVLNSMILNAPLTGTVQLGEFIDVVSGAETAAATASLNVLQLLTASAFVLEKSSGHALSIPTTGITLPGDRQRDRLGHGDRAAQVSTSGRSAARRSRRPRSASRSTRSSTLAPARATRCT